MKKIIFFIVGVFMILSTVSCNPTPNEKMNKREEYIMEYEKRLKMMDAIIGQNRIQNKQYADNPRVTDRIQLSDSETMVSLDILREVIYVYELYKKEELKLTAEDIIDLYTSPDDKKQAEFDKLVQWYQNEHGTHCHGEYIGFIYATDEIYKTKHDCSFINKEEGLYTAEEKYNLAKWGIDNIDYDFINDTVNNPNAQYTAECYVDFLCSLGLIDENGKAI